MHAHLAAATRRLSLLTLIVATLLTGALALSAKANAFTWGANSWGECNTKRPFADGFSMSFGGIVTRGHPSNWSGTYCQYWGRNNRVPGGVWPFTLGVNWSRACALDANGRGYWVSWRAPDSTYWCNA